MIQRIQTVWLLLVVILQGMFFLAVPEDNTWDILPVNRFQVLAGLIAGLALAAIFLFKKRKLQIQLTNAVLGISFATAILLVALSFWTPCNLGLNIFSAIFAYLAVRAIRKDEKLIRSYDRLR
ncbi:hypothetical protein FACS1894162_9010 [Bacteroidia bacterium]|nr:hypothetical protein FACS1894162_9010 [Bacteroidia bacterium]